MTKFDTEKDKIEIKPGQEITNQDKQPEDPKLDSTKQQKAEFEQIKEEANKSDLQKQVDELSKTVEEQKQLINQQNDTLKDWQEKLGSSEDDEELVKQGEGITDFSYDPEAEW